ncbi:MAG: hypothetical protein KAY59_07525 [Acidobacteria bacterium]|nr:hypothetical protein [Acidobacteriota bacterium]MBP8274268.1 hypothetical protein [Acidobacteriota bacterium]
MRVLTLAAKVALVLLASVSPVLAQSTGVEIPTAPKPVTAGVDIMATSAYVWRGFVPTPEASLQPAPWVKLGPVTVTSWSNLASRGSIGAPISEHDATVDYTTRRGHFAVSAGYTHYFFSDATSDRMSHEVYAGVAHDSYFSPSLRVFHDVSVGAGTYANLAISHAYRVPSTSFTLTPSVAIGYNHHQWTSRSTWSDAAFGAKLTLPAVSTRVSLSPFVTYSHSFAGDLFPSRLYAGLIISAK